MGKIYRYFETNKYEYELVNANTLRKNSVFSVFVYKKGEYPFGLMYGDICRPKDLIKTLHDLKKNWAKAMCENYGKNSKGAKG